MIRGLCLAHYPTQPLVLDKMADRTSGRIAVAKSGVFELGVVDAAPEPEQVERVDQIEHEEVELE